ncbi:hypothetical protein TIFTF001_024512 [Ficus carica]|uniref:Uncharacterized protein n=1 Tax=Ficus carica TaxID=3494 RepID=A0AA88AVR8_FICCA|nr:hypothetical protein TIFTF001_024512 [Ficus carica]
MITDDYMIFVYLQARSFTKTNDPKSWKVTVDMVDDQSSLFPAIEIVVGNMSWDTRWCLPSSFSAHTDGVAFGAPALVGCAGVLEIIKASSRVALLGLLLKRS